MHSPLPTQSYYRATAPAGPERPPLSGARASRVCIVGAGYAGLATVLGLIERGVKDVVLVEAQNVGFGASGRNGGFVFGGYSLSCQALLAQLGRERARALYRLTLDAVELIRRRISRHGIDCDVNESGVILANWFDDDARLNTIREFMLREFETDWRPVSRDELRAELKSERYFGGLREDHAFHFHPLKYALGLATAIEAGGGTILEHSPVLRIENRGAAKRVHTASGSIDAEHVVVCAGGYIGGLHPKLSPAVLPIATYVMATEPLGERLSTAMSTRAAVYDTRFAFDYYRPLPDTRILWGGRISIRERGPQAVADLLTGDLLKVYPQLEGVRVDFAWDGLMSYARHQMPQIGRLPDGTWHAQGFGGHGVGPTTAAGELLAQAIACDKPLPPGFERYGLAPTYGPAGLLAAQLSYWYYELKDWWQQ